MKNGDEFMQVLMAVWIAGQTAQMYDKVTEEKIRADCSTFMESNPIYAIAIGQNKEICRIVELLEECDKGILDIREFGARVYKRRDNIRKFASIKANSRPV